MPPATSSTVRPSSDTAWVTPRKPPGSDDDTGSTTPAPSSGAATPAASTTRTPSPVVVADTTSCGRASSVDVGVTYVASAGLADLVPTVTTSGPYKRPLSKVNSAYEYSDPAARPLSTAVVPVTG